MKSPQRKVLALIASQILHNKSPKKLFDLECGEYSNFKIKPSVKGFEILDESRNEVVIVKKRPVKWFIFDKGTKKYIELEQNNEQFRGYDYASAQYFTIDESDGDVKIYDYETDDFHYYRIED